MSLIWELTKNNSSFLVKQGNEQFTKDPFSLTSRNTKSDSGLSNDIAVCPSYTLEEGKKRKKGKVEKFQVLLKHAKKYRAPANPKDKAKKARKYGATSTFAQKYLATSVHQASHVIKALVNPSLAKKALKKLALLHEAAQIHKKYKPIKKEKKDK
jgi:Ribosomal L28e protein family